jgi:hypothetical protein
LTLVPPISTARTFSAFFIRNPSLRQRRALQARWTGGHFSGSWNRRRSRPKNVLPTTGNFSAGRVWRHGSKSITAYHTTQAAYALLDFGVMTRRPLTGGAGSDGALIVWCGI